MNANELADALQETEPYYSTDYKLFDNAATMLRQQQAEIEALKAHPVKDLEDIDINITWNENSMRDFGKDELAFARAILLKAQEK